ncbi:hypothetical protein [Rhodococcus zopfii]|uniref:hypothetical protein n=1 Tax=Rhodococcus zopfii TaxID=43772 RepID=UPI003527F8DC
MAAHRDRKRLPAELVAEDRWVRRDGKRPITPAGRPASSTDARTWSPLAAADAPSARGDGLGFVLNGDGIACIDIDHCVRADGSLEPWAARLLRRVPPTWIEVSPSGTGLHVWGLATVGAGRVIKMSNGIGVEVYDRGRYITVTRRPFGRCPRVLADIAAVVDELMMGV